MKIAITTDGNMVSHHFGHCSSYIIYDVDEKEHRIIEKSVIENPGHKPGFLPVYLAKLKVDCAIAGGMGQRAKELFAHHNIKTITDVFGQVGEVIEEYLKGNIVDRRKIFEEHNEHGGGHHSSWEDK